MGCTMGQQKAEHMPPVLGESDILRALDVVTICHKQYDLFLAFGFRLKSQGSRIRMSAAGIRVADESHGIRWEPRASAWYTPLLPTRPRYCLLAPYAMPGADLACAVLPAARFDAEHPVPYSMWM
eukprot:2534155-Rhodomonas_salina.2